MTSLRQKYVSPQIRRTITQYLIDNSEFQTVSTLDAIHVVRKRVPQCELSDHELGDLIAKSAIDVGFDVSFDGDGSHL
ncbi:conserved hypothetical protein [Mesorhizobium prunaredense]|uniref:Uncharacterized protein n=1 Tax=Mesorhizobium prunaredense TaxID=1631249 RepID=A0A1R3V8T2_9HYPH|nr:hypothetical protein [Mesorhizobium prunaredense]SIT55659.1 conserved hypothetical protein [Mesorhizobium prunaredense]